MPAPFAGDLGADGGRVRAVHRNNLPLECSEPYRGHMGHCLFQRYEQVPEHRDRGSLRASPRYLQAQPRCEPPQATLSPSWLESMGAWKTYGSMKKDMMRLLPNADTKRVFDVAATSARPRPR